MMNQNNLEFDSINHIYTLNKKIIPSVTQILQSEGFYPDFSLINSLIMERARQWGIAIHKLTELSDKGTLDYDTVSGELKPVLATWKKFIMDYKIDFLSEWIEKPFYSPTYEYGFTLDRIGRIKKKLILLDIKSSEETNPVNGLQLAGYQIGFEERTKLKIDERWVVCLTPDKYIVTPYTNQSDRVTFLSARMCHHWKEKNLWKK